MDGLFKHRRGDFFTKKLTDLESLQRQSVRWIEQLGKRDGVTQAMEILDIGTLQQRRLIKDNILYMRRSVLRI